MLSTPPAFVLSQDQTLHDRLFVWLLFIALLIKIARHFCLAHRLIRSLYCSVFKESSLFKRLDYLTTIRYFLSSTFLKFFEGILHRGRRSRGDRYDDTMDGRVCQLGFLSFLLICMERFLRWTRPGAVRVLRFDSASGAEGCGIALAGDEYFAACGGENHTTAPSARWKCTPFCRLRRRLSTGKRLTRFSVACGSLRIVFACHPGGGDSSGAYP